MQKNNISRITCRQSRGLHTLIVEDLPEHRQSSMVRASNRCQAQYERRAIIHSRCMKARGSLSFFTPKILTELARNLSSRMHHRGNDLELRHAACNDNGRLRFPYSFGATELTAMSATCRAANDMASRNAYARERRTAATPQIAARNDCAIPRVTFINASSRRETGLCDRQLTEFPARLLSRAIRDALERSGLRRTRR